MRKYKEFNKTIKRTSLKTSKSSESFIKHLEKIYSDLVSTPQFNDEEVFFEESGVSFFHKETKDELASLLMTCLSLYINQTGNKASHVIKNEELKTYAEAFESVSLGKHILLMKNSLGITELTVRDEEDGKCV